MESREEIIFEKRRFLVIGMVFFILSLTIITTPLWLILIIAGYFSIQEGNTSGGIFILAIGAMMTIIAPYLFWLNYRYFGARNFPLMVLDNYGLHFFNTKQVFVPWSEVVNARIQTVQGMTTIRIEPMFPHKYHRRFQAWAAPEFMIATFTLKGRAEDLLKAIREHKKYIGTSPR